MPARKLPAPEPDSRRRSGRSSAPKRSYVEEDVEDPPPQSKPRQNGPRQDTKKQRREESQTDSSDERTRRVEILPLEKLRDDGGVAYDDDRVHRNTLLFLRDLKANNNRPWLKAHDGEYRRALKDWNSFVEAATATVTIADDTVPELPVRDVVFRIHRDVRFSRDPTPYKPHLSAAWSRTGRKGPYAAYYVHCAPGSCFVAGGLWQPSAEHLARLRGSIDGQPRRWRRALNHELFKNVFFADLNKAKAKARTKTKTKEKGKTILKKNKTTNKEDEEEDDEEVVRAFVACNQENALKNHPMGYDKTHPDIALLNLKRFIVKVDIDDGAFSGDDAQSRFARIFSALQPFVSFLNGIVLPDPNDQDDDQQEEDEDGEDGDGNASSPSHE